MRQQELLQHNRKGKGRGERDWLEKNWGRQNLWIMCNGGVLNKLGHELGGCRNGMTVCVHTLGLKWEF